MRTEVGKRVVVIASGETERRALPHLLRHLEDRGIVLESIRVPPRGLPMRPDMVEKLIKSAWFANPRTPPDKFVVLVDVDQKDPAEALHELERELPRRTKGVEARLLFAYAQQHLEAWYFADAQRLREFLGRNLGVVDTSRPDDIHNPKLHLKQLLGDRVYTSRVSEEIARGLTPATIAGRSPSFRAFSEAVENGGSALTEA